MSTISHPLLLSDDPRPIHFMGIAGAGMNALAELFHRRGQVVHGCDTRVIGCEKLERLGVQLFHGHSPEHLSECRALVVSSAIPREHAEVRRASELGIPVVRRAEALAQGVSGGTLVAIAGTHGKTTTTVMTTLALAAAGGLPTGVVGGKVAAWGGNLYAGGQDLFVVEADEYDRSFLALTPSIAVVTNIEADHLDIYADLADLTAAFGAFVAHSARVVVCNDDPGARALSLPHGVRRISYGIAGGSAVPTIAAANVTSALVSSFDVVHAELGLLGRVKLTVPGQHNVRNALAALAVGLELGLPFDLLAQGVQQFRGVERRFQILRAGAALTVVDDYAHHPTEIRATLAAARVAFPGRRLIAAFQPHLFSRTRDLAGEFGAALADADLVFLTGIYPAREQPIPGVSVTLVEQALQRAGGRLAWCGSHAALLASLRATLSRGDVVLFMGAGDITESAHTLAADPSVGDSH